MTRSSQIYSGRSLAVFLDTSIQKSETLLTKATPTTTSAVSPSVARLNPLPSTTLFVAAALELSTPDPVWLGPVPCEVVYVPPVSVAIVTLEALAAKVLPLLTVEAML